MPNLPSPALPQPDLGRDRWMPSFRSGHLLGGLLGLGCLAMALSWMLSGTRWGHAFDLATPSALFLCGGLTAFLRGRARPEERRGWIWVGLSGVLVGLGGLLRLLAPGLGRWPLLLMLLGGVSQGLGILAWPHAPRRLPERINKAMDGLVFALALAFILWVLGWGSNFLSSTEPVPVRALSLAFPMLPIAVLGLVIYLGANRPFQLLRGPVGWISLGLLLALLGNLAWGMKTLKGSYVQGTGLWEGLSFFIPLCRLAAPLSAHGVGQRPDDEVQDHRRLAVLLPYLPVVPALALGAWSLLGAALKDPVPTWIAVAMVTLLLARQYRALRQVHLLTAHLEARVRSRTRELEDSQAIVLQVQRMNTMSSLGAGIAHDLNNLITSSLSITELLALEAAEGRTPGPELLHGLQTSLRQTASLTTSLMGLGRQEAMEQPQWFDLGRWLQEVEPPLKALLPRGIRLSCRAGEPPLAILGRPSQWTQILVNLVSNARDAMPGGGNISVDLSRQGEEALLVVEDDGPGMDAEVRARLFEPFFTTKAPGKGTGLGLASVRLLAERAGGTVEVRSEPGRGARFTLRVPASAAPQA